MGVEIEAATASGEQTKIGSEAVARLRGSLNGQLLRPEDGGYDAARTVWNGLIDVNGGAILGHVAA